MDIFVNYGAIASWNFKKNILIIHFYPALVLKFAVML